VRVEGGDVVSQGGAREVNGEFLGPMRIVGLLCKYGTCLCVLRRVEYFICSCSVFSVSARHAGVSCAFGRWAAVGWRTASASAQSSPALKFKVGGGLRDVACLVAMKRKHRAECEIPRFQVLCCGMRASASGRREVPMQYVQVTLGTCATTRGYLSDK
jgi:hypothetical protein